MRTKLFLLLIILSLNYLRLNAQIDPNTLCPPCSGAVCSFVSPSDEYVYVDANGWGHISGTHYESLLPCYFDISFKIRECNCPGYLGTIREIFIGKIDLDPMCQGMNYGAIMTNAIKMLLRGSWLFYGANTPLTWDVVISMPACWRFDQNSLIPCSTNVCCQTRYWIGNRGNIITATERLEVPPNNCGGIIGGSCDYYCNVNDLPVGTNLWEDEGEALCSNNDNCPNEPLEYAGQDINCECNPGYNNGDPTCCLQNPPTCNDACYNNYLGGVQGTTMFKLPYAQPVYVYVGYKRCPNGAKEIFIKYIQSYNWQIPVPPSPEWNDIFDLIVASVLKRAPIFFNECLDCSQGVITNYYVYSPKCFRAILLGGSNYLYAPCEPEECCWISYNICDNYVIGDPIPGCENYYMRTTTATSEYSRSDPEPANCTTECPYDACLYLPLRGDWIGYGTQLPKRPENFERSNKTAEISITYDMKSNILKVQNIPFIGNNSYSMKIFNVLGNIVFSCNASGESKEISCNVKNISSGLYIILLSDGKGKLLITKSVLIVK